MQATKEQMVNAIASYRKQKKQGFEIIQSLETRKDKIGETYRQIVKEGFRDEFLKDFNINPEYVEKPSFLVDVGAGMANVFDGIGQFTRFVADQFTGGNRYEEFTAKKESEREAYQTAREKSGKGMNVGAFIGENVAMLPALTLGKTYQGVKAVSGLTKKGLTASKITAQNAGIGGALTGIGFAKDSDERAKNMAMGAVGGAFAPIVIEPALKATGKVLGKVSKGATRRIEQATGAEQARQIEIARQADYLVKQGANAQDIKLTKKQRKIAYETAKDLLNKGQKPDSTALVRKAVLDDHNITGTQAQVTGNHIDWAKEKELAKQNNNLQAQFNQNRDDLKLITQKLADDTGQQDIDTFAKMQNSIETMNKHHANAKQQQKDLYEQARNATGNDLTLDWQNGLPVLEKHLKDNGIQGIGRIKNIINGQLDENGKLTVLGAENVKKAVNRMFTNGRDGQTDWAIGQVKQHLDDWIDNANVSGMGDDAMVAWSRAKNTYKEHAKTVDDIPFFKASINGLEPDKAFDKYVVRGNVAEIQKLRKYLEKTGETQVLADLQGATIGHILGKATDIDGNGFSYANFAKAINSINDNRLTAILTDEQLHQLKEIRKVANILLKEPADSPVNRSNTGNALFNLVVGLADKIPKNPVSQALLSKARSFADTVEYYKVSSGKIPTITTRQRTLLERAGISDDTIQALTRPVIVPTAIGAKQAGQESYAQDDNDFSWGDDNWQDDEQIANIPTEQAPQHFDNQGEQNTPQIELPSNFENATFEKTGEQGAFDPMGEQVVGEIGGDMGQNGGDFDPISTIGNGLASLIPPPKNPANMGNYERYVQSAVGRIMQTPQMGFILDQIQSDNPDFARIKKAQMSLSHTPEWKNFEQNLPEQIKQKINGANILALLTNQMDIFNPTF